MRATVASIVVVVALVGALLLGPRLGRTSAGPTPTRAVQTTTDSPADRELVALAALPIETEEQIRVARARWRAFARTHGAEYQLHAARALEQIDRQMDRLASVELGRIGSLLNNLQLDQQYSRGVEIIDGFLARFPDTPSAARLGSIRHQLGILARRKEIARYSADFTPLRRGQRTPPDLDGMRVVAPRALAPADRMLGLMRAGESRLGLAFDVARVTSEATLEVRLYAGVVDFIYSDSPITVTINDEILLDGWRPYRDTGMTYRWPIAGKIRPGTNLIRLSLHPTASTVCFLAELRVVLHE